MQGLLANWLWQGCAVALVATVVLRLSRRMSATTRYHLWWITLVVILMLPMGSFQMPAAGGQEASSRPRVSDDALEIRAASGTAEAGSRTLGAGTVVLPALPRWSGILLAFAWVAWVAVSIARTTAALVTLRRAKRSARPFPATREARLRTWLSLRARGRRTRLIISDEVRAAAVLGLTSPTIAVAPVTLNALSDDELDQIVVHEWAHVHRRDDVARLVQRLIVALAGLHPAVWWIDRQLHLERETACDDWAVNATGSAKSLAVCLTKLASLPGRRPDDVLLPAALLSSELTTRVVRLLDRRRNTSTARALGVPMLIVPVLGVLALTVASMELVVTASIGAERSHRTAPSVIDVRQAAVAAPRAIAPSETVLAPASSRRASRRFPTTAAVTPRFAALADSTADGESPATAQAGAGAPTQKPDVHASSPVPHEIAQRPLGVGELPGTSTAVTGDIVAAPAQEATAPSGQESAKNPTLWGAAADAGVTVGRGSQKAAVATAGFVTRVSKSIAHVF